MRPRFPGPYANGCRCSPNNQLQLWSFVDKGDCVSALFRVFVIVVVIGPRVNIPDHDFRTFFLRTPPSSVTTRRSGFGNRINRISGQLIIKLDMPLIAETFGNVGAGPPPSRCFSYGIIACAQGSFQDKPQIPYHTAYAVGTI
jgi:hypothetical protein